MTKKSLLHNEFDFYQHFLKTSCKHPAQISTNSYLAVILTKELFLKLTFNLSGYKKLMCLGVAMQVIAINGFNAQCEAKGVQREVSLFMLQDEPIQVGDHVMVHVGYAIQKLTEQEARSIWELLDQVLTADQEN